ncbi:MAG TPA: fatty acid oxidation complex subunit alpha FadJ [Thermodesulfobacteriota bacterium]
MKAFSLELDTDGIVVITIDLEGEKVNKLGLGNLSEIETLLSRLESETEIKAAVLISSKEDNFIVGGDVKEFLKLTSINEGRALSLRAQEVINRIENSKVPFVAAIHGACLGGGLEIALACRYRIATDDSKTILGLPEVKLGLVPAAGGTQRLPRLIGISRALDLILTGRNINSKEAERIGLVDEVVPKEVLLDVAKKQALRIFSEKKKIKHRRTLSAGEVLMEKNPLGRKFLFDKARNEIVKKTLGHYLAPILAHEAVEIGIKHGFKRGLHVESAHFGELALSDVARQLINTFLATNAIKKESGSNIPELKLSRIEKIGIVGAGLMGSGIASISADIGVAVRMKDKDDIGVGRGLKACYEYLQEMYKKHHITELEMGKRLNLISWTSDFTGFRRADVVIEAVFEELELKQKVLQEVESFTRDDCILASNTSSIPINEIGSRLKRRSNIVGMHFFSPVHEIRLIEIVKTPEASDLTIDTAVEFGKRLGKIPIVVKDRVGFYTTRILSPYINEAINLVEEGAAVDDIDGAMVEFGFPVGPLMFLDETGIDVGVKIAKVIYEGFGERLKPSSNLYGLVEEGRMGKKNGKGFYTYNNKTKTVDKSVYTFFNFQQVREPFPMEEIQERLVLSMINEAVLCLEEGTIRSPRDGDIGAVLGLGFPPFLGGPFRYIDLIGAGVALDRLENLAYRFSPRFAPAGLLRNLANRGRKFYID